MACKKSRNGDVLKLHEKAGLRMFPCNQPCAKVNNYFFVGQCSYDNIIHCKYQSIKI